MADRWKVRSDEETDEETRGNKTAKAKTWELGKEKGKRARTNRRKRDQKRWSGMNDSSELNTYVSITGTLPFMGVHR